MQKLFDVRRNSVDYTTVLIHDVSFMSQYKSCPAIDGQLSDSRVTMKMQGDLLCEGSRKMSPWCKSGLSQGLTILNLRTRFKLLCAGLLKMAKLPERL